MKVGGLSGAWGERAAAAYAEAAGARVVDRNVRCAQGEVDLVLEHGGGYAFGEVKARRRHALETGLGAVGRTKQRRVVATAHEWLAARGLHPERVRLRFDVFVVTLGDVPGGPPRVLWIQDAYRADWL